MKKKRKPYKLHDFFEAIQFLLVVLVVTNIVQCSIILQGCGSDPWDPSPGFVCKNGTNSECEMIVQLEEAFIRAKVKPYYTEFWFAHEGDEDHWPHQFHDHPNWCGFNAMVSIEWENYDPVVWIKSTCRNLPTHCAHEVLHEIWPIGHPDIMMETLGKIMKEYNNG